MFGHELVIQDRRRATEQAATEHRLARQFARTRRDRPSRTAGPARWARLVAWMPPPHQRRGSRTCHPAPPPRSRLKRRASTTSRRTRCDTTPTA